MELQAIFAGCTGGAGGLARGAVTSTRLTHLVCVRIMRCRAARNTVTTMQVRFYSRHVTASTCRSIRSAVLTIPTTVLALIVSILVCKRRTCVETSVNRQHLPGFTCRTVRICTRTVFTWR